MQTIKKILVPTDFSEPAMHAVNYAAKLAVPAGAKILLFHVNHLPALMTTEQAFATDYVKLDNDIKESLNRIRDEVSTSSGLKNIEVKTVIGFATEEIKAEADRSGADMIVMGTRGASGLGEIFIGSQTARIIEQSACPVLAVPADAPVKLPSKIAFATNFNDNELEPISQLVSMFSHLNPEILISHIHETGDVRLEERTNDYFKGQVETRISYRNISFHEASGPSVELALKEFALLNQVDWLSTAMRKRNFFEKLISKSLTKEIAFHTHIPLLAFHIKEN